MKRLVLLLSATLIISLLALAGAAQKSARKSAASGPPKSATDVITAGGVMSHIKVLASDEYEGRGPGTRENPSRPVWPVTTV